MKIEVPVATCRAYSTCTQTRMHPSASACVYEHPLIRAIFFSSRFRSFYFRASYTLHPPPPPFFFRACTIRALFALRASAKV